MKKVLALAVAAAGVVYIRRKVEQQRSERDLHAATSRMTSPPAGTTSGAWAAASDRP